MINANNVTRKLDVSVFHNKNVVLLLYCKNIAVYICIFILYNIIVGSCQKQQRKITLISCF